jgi:5-methylcytosine-specific restriction endonuclease McrA
MIVPGPEWFRHLQAHSDRRRPRKGSSGNWKRIRALALARDAHRCQQCGSTSDLEVHHIDRDWRNNELANLATVCARCHDAIR